MRKYRYAKNAAKRERLRVESHRLPVDPMLMTLNGSVAQGAPALNAGRENGRMGEWEYGRHFPFSICHFSFAIVRIPVRTSRATDVRDPDNGK